MASLHHCHAPLQTRVTAQTREAIDLLCLFQDPNIRPVPLSDGLQRQPQEPHKSGTQVKPHRTQYRGKDPGRALRSDVMCGPYLQNHGGIAD